MLSALAAASALGVGVLRVVPHAVCYSCRTQLAALAPLICLAGAYAVLNTCIVCSYSAVLRLGARVGACEVAERVDRVLSELNLRAIRKQQGFAGTTAEISGGERQRCVCSARYYGLCVWCSIWFSSMLECVWPYVRQRSSTKGWDHLQQQLAVVCETKTAWNNQL